MSVSSYKDLLSSTTAAWLALAAMLAVATPAAAQNAEIQSFEVTPIVGVRLGGTFDIQTEQPSQIQAVLKDASSYGLSAGVRFDDCGTVGVGGCFVVLSGRLMPQFELSVGPVVRF
jgi:hypothetical protein